MEFPKLTDNLSIISALGDNPGADNGLSAEELKAKFDEAALILQRYLNGTLVERLNEIFAGGPGVPSDGLNMNGAINMNRNPLQNVRDPESDHEGMNLGYANRHFVPNNRTVNGKALNENISLNAGDVDARSNTWLPTLAEIGAVPKFTLLWTNGSPGNGWGATPISLDLSEYSWVMLTFRSHKGAAYYQRTFIPVVLQSGLSTSQRARLETVMGGGYYRHVTVTSTGLTFTNGIKYSDSSESNEYCTPCQIHGCNFT